MATVILLELRGFSTLGFCVLLFDRTELSFNEVVILKVPGVGLFDKR